MSHLLPDAVDAIVRLRMREYEAQGGPTEADFERIRKFAQVLAEQGDALLYSIPGKTARMVNSLADAIAVLSFVPGGIKVFGRHYVASCSSSHDKE